MVNRKTYIHSVLRKLPVMFVYLLFLSVQVLFNLDIYSQPAVLLQPVITAKLSNHTGRQTWKFRLDKKTDKSTIRLNKRFEPAGMPGFPIFEIHTPIVYAQLVERCPDNFGIYQSACLHKHTLRGPPQLAI